MLAHVDAQTNTLLAQFGQTIFEIPTKNYHLLDEPGWKAVPGGELLSGGAYSMQDQAAFIRSSRTKDLVQFAFVAHHETLHFKSHQVLQRLYPGKDFLPYRRGFEIVTRHGHRTYFRKLDEAVIQELTNRFVQEQLTQYPATKDALAASETRGQLLQKHAVRLNADDQRALAGAVYIGELPPGAEDVFSQDAQAASAASGKAKTFCPRMSPSGRKIPAPLHQIPHYQPKSQRQKAKIRALTLTQISSPQDSNFAARSPGFWHTETATRQGDGQIQHPSAGHPSAKRARSDQ
jgi:hypothetical protein